MFLIDEFEASNLKHDLPCRLRPSIIYVFIQLHLSSIIFPVSISSKFTFHGHFSTIHDEQPHIWSANYHLYKNLFRLTPKNVGSSLRVFNSSLF